MVLAFYSLPRPNILAESAPPFVASSAIDGNSWIQADVIYKPNPPSEPAPVPPTPPKVKIALIHGSYCSCVNFAKSLTGFSQSIGLAKNWPVNAKTPSVGGVVVLRAGRTGHVAYISDVTGTDFGIREANYSPCQLTVRRISIDDADIIGFWTP